MQAQSKVLKSSVLLATFLVFAREAIDLILDGFIPMVGETSIFVGYIPVAIEMLSVVGWTSIHVTKDPLLMTVDFITAVLVTWDPTCGWFNPLCWVSWIPPSCRLNRLFHPIFDHIFLSWQTPHFQQLHPLSALQRHEISRWWRHEPHGCGQRCSGRRWRPFGRSSSFDLALECLVLVLTCIHHILGIPVN